MTPKRASTDTATHTESATPSDPALGHAEALELLDRMGHDLKMLRDFVVVEQRGLDRKPLTPKRLARLRLVSDDLASAVRLASRHAKS